MKTSLFDYPLDEKNIAQSPAEPRDFSRLLVVDRETGEKKDLIFRDIIDELDENDVLVFNETKVIKARLKGYVILKDGRKKEVEIFLLQQKGLDLWECAVFPGERLKPGKTVLFEGSDMEGHIEEVTYSGRIIRFNISGEAFFEETSKIGSIPLPPYIEADNQTIEQYNTVFAKHEGSAAAPTAGLHFTEELLERIQNKGIKIEKVLLHIGLGTFKTIKTENIKDHVMHHEYIAISDEVADRLNEYKKDGKKIIAVGTTVVRTLESLSDDDHVIRGGEKETNIFIYPGYSFKFVDKMITNFHLPGSSLLMLVSAFYNREKILESYDQAQKDGYRFFSFGDAMFIR